MTMYVACSACGSDATKTGAEYHDGKMCPVYTCIICNKPTVVLPEGQCVAAN